MLRKASSGVSGEQPNGGLPHPACHPSSGFASHPPSTKSFKSSAFSDSVSRVVKWDLEKVNQNHFFPLWNVLNVPEMCIRNTFRDWRCPILPAPLQGCLRSRKPRLPRNARSRISDGCAALFSASVCDRSAGLFFRSPEMAGPGCWSSSGVCCR